MSLAAEIGARATGPGIAPRRLARLALVLLCGCNGLLGFDEGKLRPEGTGGSGATGTGGSGGAGGHGGVGGDDAPPPTFAWIAQLRGTDNDFVGGLAFDASGGLGVCGSFRVDLSYEIDGTPSDQLDSVDGADLFVLRLEPAGSLRWLQRFGGAGDQFCTSVAFDGAGVAQVTGAITGQVAFGSHVLPGGAELTAYLARFDASGTAIMAHGFDVGGRHVPYAVDVAPDDRTWFVGAFADVATFAGQTIRTGLDVDAGFAASLDHFGTEGLAGIGADGSSDEQPQSANGVTAATASQILVVGGNGGTLVAPASSATAAAEADPFLAELDGQAALTRVRGFASSGYSLAAAVAADPAGNVVLAGYFTTDLQLGDGYVLSAHGGRDLFIAKLAADWSTTWAVGFGGTGNQEARRLAQDERGNVYVAATVAGPIDIDGHSIVPEGDVDGVLLGLRPDGEYWFHATFRSPGSARVEYVAYDPAGSRIAVAGAFDRDLSISINDTAAGPTLSAQGGIDGFVAVLDAPAGR